MEHLKTLSMPAWRLSGEDAIRLTILAASAGLVVVSTAAILYLPFVFSLAVPVALLATLVVLRYPTLSLIGIFFGRMTVDLLWWVPAGLGLNFMEVFTGGITVLLVIMCLRSLNGVIEHPFFPAVALWTTLLLVGAAQQPEARVVAELLARYLSPMLILLLVSIHFRQARHRKLLLVWIAAAGLLPIALGLFHWSSGQAATLQMSGYDRLSGGYSNIADHGLSMANFAMVGLIWLWQYRSGWKSAAIIGYILACIFLLVMTYTRTAVVGLTAFFFVYTFLHGDRRLLLIGVVAAAIVLLTNTTAQDRFSDFSRFFIVDAGQHTDQLGSGRLGIWRRSFEAFFNQPFLQILVGNGLNSQYLLANGQDSHSDYISLMLQVGPIGLLIWAGMQVEVTRRAFVELAYKTLPFTRTLLVAIIALSACVLVSNTLSNAYLSRVTLSWYWWGMAGLLFAIQADRQQSKTG